MIQNKKSEYDYAFTERYECGIVLTSAEVKAIAANKCSIIGAHCKILNNELFLIGASMVVADADQLRIRKLLMHRSEIDKLAGKIKEKGFTLIPTKLYLSKGKFKLEIGLGKGKREFDKRDTEKKRDIENESRRIVKSQKLS